MRRILFVAVAIIAGVTVLLQSCKKDDNNEPIEVPVSSVSLDCNELTLTVGDTRTLVASVAPENADDKALRWISLDPDIVSVDENGNMTALSKGTGKVTARPASEQSFDKAAYCVVTVVDKVIPAEEITLNKEFLNMFSNRSYQLTATVKPADATVTEIVWESSDEDVAIVNEKGVVTALKDGVAFISASVKNTEGTIFSECGVTVYGVSLSKTSAIIGVKDELALAPYIDSKSIAYSDIVFTPASGAYAETVKVNNDELRQVVGLSAGYAVIVGLYRGSIEMDTSLNLAFEVEVEDTFLTYISDMFNISGMGAVATTEEILAGTVNVGDKVLIMQAVDTCKNYAVRVAGLEKHKEKMTSATVGDTGVGFFLGTDIPYKSVKYGSAIMEMSTQRIVTTKELTGMLTVTKSNPIFKGDHMIAVSNNAKTVVRIVDIGDNEMLKPGKTYFNIKVETVSKENYYDSIICSLGQKITLKKDATEIGTFVVSDFDGASE